MLAFYLIFWARRDVEGEGKSCRPLLSISHVPPLFLTTDFFLASTCQKKKNSETASGKFEYDAAAFFAFDTSFHSKDGNNMQQEKQKNAQAREEHRSNEAQDHWERVVLTKLGHTSRLGRELTQNQHLNFHISQSVAGAARHTSVSSEWPSLCSPFSWFFVLFRRKDFVLSMRWS